MRTHRATAFTSFLFLGFLEIGQIIENPFNYDVNDLDLDTLCEGIGRNIEQMVAVRGLFLGLARHAACGKLTPLYF